MIINKFTLFARRFRDPEPGDDGAGEDRGDNWTPTEDIDDVVAKETPAVEKPLPKDKAAALKELGGEEEKGAEGEEEQTDEEKAAAAAAAAADKKKDGRIPLKRHEAILAREREKREQAEAALKGYQGAQTVVKTNDAINERETKIAGLQVEYDKALVDGETTKASSLMTQIRKLDREVSALDAEAKIAAAESRAVETTRYAVALERVEAAYPQLNEDHDDFDKEVYDEVLDLVKAYRHSGRTPTDALQKAVKVMLGSKTNAQAAATEVKPRVDAADDKSAETRAARAKAANEKALKAVAGSPGTATARAGLNSDAAGATRTAKDVIKMSQAEFAQFAERDAKEMARLRGDEVDA